MKISVVIPTYNRAKLLAHTLPALAAQVTGDGVEYEVIFVNNGSTDDTAEVLMQAAERWPGYFRYFRIDPTGGPSAPRNRGVREANGEVIVLLDDDVLPEPGLVMAFAEFHARHPEPEAAAIGEAYVPEHLLEDPISKFHIFPYDDVRKLERLTYLHFWTCNVSVKRDFMLNRGMFDERFLYYEDVLCGHRLEAAGMRLFFWPDARGQHWHQMTAAGLPAKGRFLGRWLQPFLDRIPDPAAMARFGVLSAKLPFPLLVKRTLGRMAFYAMDNPVTWTVLEAMGARGPKRSAISDYYYGLIFRRSMLEGYYEAKRAADAGHPLELTNVASAVADRGDC